MGHDSIKEIFTIFSGLSLDVSIPKTFPHSNRRNATHRSLPASNHAITPRAAGASTHVAGESAVFEGGGPARTGLARVPGGG